MKRTLPLFLAAAVSLTALPLRAQVSDFPTADAPVEGAPPPSAMDNSSMIPPDTEIIDMPTAAVLDNMSFNTRTRFFAGGGLLEYLSFGVFPRVNIGSSFNVDKLVGTGSPVQVTRPELQLKLRFYDGDRVIPSFALGFDGQGYIYNRRDKAYNHRQRGLYVVGSQEIGLPGLEFHAGMNIADFDSNSIYGMLGTTLNIQDKVKLMTEWDAINDFHDSRLNMGLRIYITPRFHAGFSVRAIGHGGYFPNGVKRGPERIAQFKYTGSF